MSTDDRKNLRLHPDIHELLKVEAAKSRITMQDLVKEGIKLHIKQRVADSKKGGEFIEMKSSRSKKSEG